MIDERIVPALEPLAPVLRKLMDADENVRTSAFHELVTAVRGLTLDDDGAAALLRIATEVAFPAQKSAWNNPAHELVFALVEPPRPALVEPLAAAYARASARTKSALLSALGAVGTRAAAKAFMRCVREHGWPPRAYARVFRELYKLAEFPDVLFPDLVVLASAQLPDVANVLIYALTSGRLDPARVDLSPLAPLAFDTLAKALPVVEAAQQEGTAWRAGEEYAEPRGTVGVWLDVCGHVGQASDVVPLLRRATALRDPKLAAFAAMALVRRGEPVEAEVLDRIAADHETRALLFDYLANLQALAQFPARWRTWEAFAAADMSQWLEYPSELGYVPEALERMETFTVGPRTLYVWRFLADGAWKAGVSGVYELTGEPRPVHGSSTFSRFELADSKTPEEHANAVLETLAEWAKHRQA